MKFELAKEGFVFQCVPNSSAAVAAGSRTAITRDGELVCVYMVQSALGTNDFCPTISRSTDGGDTWKSEGAIWPGLKGRDSIFCSVGGSPAGDLFLFGIRVPVSQAGESIWCEATQGLKQNELMWARSTDGGRTWTEPHTVPLPIAGSAEQTSPICVTRAGRWLTCYSPYNTFDPNLLVDRNQAVAMLSDDEGRSWRHSSMLRFDDTGSGAAEAWIIELTDGRVLGTSWHLNHRDGTDYPNAYALSTDGGATWARTQSTGIQGQSTGLAPLPGGRALFIYNQRKHGEIGVWLAVVKPTESDFGVESNEIIWRAETPTQRHDSADHSQWTDFAFGEPSVTLLPEGTLLVSLWCTQPSGHGIRYLKLRLKG